MPSTKKVEFAVFAPGFDQNVGGYIVLHYLCHLLNKLGHTAHLIPLFSSAEVSPVDADERVRDLFEQREAIRRTPYALNPAWNTPIYRRPLKGIAKRDDLVVVYPEVVFGNPLRAKNVARWLLHDPGFHHKDVYFVPGEVHFRYLEMHKAVPMPWIEVAEQLLTVTYVPWEHYQPPPEGSTRNGTAYLLRKGKGKPLVHELEGSIQIDGKHHADIGAIFRRVTTFISYDSRTFYSVLAALAGTDSIVIPDEGISLEEWQPDPTLRAGIAYGFSDLERAQRSQREVSSNIEKVVHQSEKSVSDFIDFWSRRLLL